MKRIIYSLVLLNILIQATFAQDAIGYSRVQGNDGLLNLSVISEADAISLGHGVVKIVLPDGSIGAAHLVSTSDPLASEVRIHTSYGTYAWKKLKLYIKTYDQIGAIKSLILTNDGGLAAAGGMYGIGAGGQEMYALKINDDGSVNWGNAYGYSQQEYAEAISLLSGNAGYVLGGFTASGSGGNGDMDLKKIYNNGSLDWELWLGTSEWDRGYDVMQDASGNLVITGSVDNTSSHLSDILTVKVNIHGTILWSKTYGGSGHDRSYSIISNDLGQYAMAGYTETNTAGGADMLLNIIEVTGTVDNSITIGGGDDDYAYDMVQDSDGNYVVAGYTYSFGAGQSDYYIVKLDAAGNSIWGYAYGGTNYEFAREIIETNDHGYAIIGETWSYGAGGKDFWVLKLDHSGVSEWGLTMGGVDDDYGNTITEGIDGCLYIAGYTQGFEGGSGALVAKLSPDALSCLVMGGGTDATTAAKEEISLCRTENMAGHKTEHRIQIHSNPGVLERKPPAFFSVLNKNRAVTSFTPTVFTICE